MKTLFIRTSRKNSRRLAVLLGLVLFLLLPSALMAQDVSGLKRKAERGDAAAQVDLGFAYENGKGVPQDDKEAVKWYRKAADQGHPQAQSNLGNM